MSTPTLEELNEEIQALKSSLNKFEKREREMHKNKYDKSYSKLRNAINKTTEIQNVIKNTHEKLGISDLLSDLILINNPYSDKLGFRFADIIQEKVEEILLSSIPDDQDENGKKNRFIRILSKVINNPIADVILKSNPVGAVVGNVINTATNLIDTTWKKVERTTIGNGLKEIALTTKDEITNEKLRLFKQSIEKYSKFYSQMLLVSQRFDIRIDVLKNSFDGVYISYKDLKHKFIKKLNLDFDSPFDSLDELFEKNDSNNKNFDFQSVLNKDWVKNGLEFYSGLPDVENEASKYSDEFAKTLRTFIQDYVEILKIPINDNWTSEEIDLNKINLIIDKLNTFLDSNTSVTAISDPSTSSETLTIVTFKDNLTKFVA